MHTLPNLIQYVTIKQKYKNCLNFTYIWINCHGYRKKSGQVKKVPGQINFKGDLPWAGPSQNISTSLIYIYIYVYFTYLL